MPVLKKNEMKPVVLKMDNARNVIKQNGISADQGWEGWSMRIFTLQKEGYTPFHTHDWPHINYIIAGSGTLYIDGREQSVSAGDTAYVRGGEEHQFKNSGDEDFSFICIVPEEGDK